MMSKNRIWELDALRGLCILGMIAVHFLFDLTGFNGLPSALLFLADWGGAAFFLISGICATLGSRCIRRGLTVLGCGLAVSTVTVIMYRLGLAPKALIIYFGVLHCLGVCMLLWHFFRNLPTAVLAVLSAVFIAIGLLIQNVRIDVRWLVWLGLRYEGFATSDYFPLLPFLGFFLLGAVLGRLLYREKRSLLPGVRGFHALQWMGRQSLPIYMLHQPLYEPTDGYPASGGHWPGLSDSVFPDRDFVWLFEKSLLSET